MTATLTPADVDPLQAGVIEEARSRQRRHRRVGAGLVLAGALVAAAALGFAGGGGSGAGHAEHSRAPRPLRAGALSPAACTVKRGFADGPPSRTLLSILAVLRRPAGAADAIPSPYNDDLTAGFVTRVYSRYIRRTREFAGATYFIYPAIVGGCSGEHAQEGIVERAVHVNLGHGDIGGEGGGGWSAAEIEGGRAWSTGAPGSETTDTVTMVVPDGVASVTLLYAAGRASGYSPKISPPATVTAPVVGNELVVTVPRSGGSASSPRLMIWRAADGRVLRTFHAL